MARWRPVAVAMRRRRSGSPAAVAGRRRGAASRRRRRQRRRHATRTTTRTTTTDGVERSPTTRPWPRATARSEPRPPSRSRRTISTRTRCPCRALESKLRDGVLETFDRIAEAYLGLRELQEQRLTLIQARRSVSAELDRALPDGPRGHGRADAAGLAQQQPGRGAGPAAVRRQQAPGQTSRASCSGWRSAAGSPARASSSTIWATSSTTTGSTAWRG